MIDGWQHTTRTVTPAALDMRPVDVSAGLGKTVTRLFIPLADITTMPGRIRRSPDVTHLILLNVAINTGRKATTAVLVVINPQPLLLATFSAAAL